MMIVHSVPVRMRNVSDKIIGKIKTHYKCNNFFPDFAPFVRYVEKQGRAKQAKDNIIRRRKDAILRAL